ncbi:MAG TPA: ferrous iron transport protein A [Victivallales bacterium]|nr:ferrous iron transport protein A [Victivallales bacterium]
MTLSESHEGQSLMIKRISGGGAIKQRLLDMGVGRGGKILVERYAPLKDPIQIRVKGYSLALRVAEGRLIEVEPCDD